MFMIFSTLEIHFLFFGNEFGEGTYTPQSMGTKKSPRALRGLTTFYSTISMTLSLSATFRVVDTLSPITEPPDFLIVRQESLG
jgi:hypothetical protein